jgi:hypothetical protein
MALLCGQSEIDADRFRRLRKADRFPVVTAPLPEYIESRFPPPCGELQKPYVLRLVEAEELALAAGDGNSVQAAGYVPLDQFSEAGLVERLVGCERRGRRGHDAENVFWSILVSFDYAELFDTHQAVEMHDIAPELRQPFGGARIARPGQLDAQILDDPPRSVGHHQHPIA